MKRRSDSAAEFEPKARRIRARAADILASLPVEDPDEVWARRAALLGEIDGTPPVAVARPRRLRNGVWRWPR